MQFKKMNCAKCGKRDFANFRIGTKQVCFDCFQKRCAELIAKQPPPPTKYLMSASGRAA